MTKNKGVGSGNGEGSKATRFGQPNGNPTCPQKEAKAMRDFLSKLRQMTEREIRAYIADESNPYIKRKAAQTLVKMDKPKELFGFINQVEGMPVQPVSTDAPPVVNININIDGIGKPDE